MKFAWLYGAADERWSPSMRREWIEMCDKTPPDVKEHVSLHAEGVD